MESPLQNHTVEAFISYAQRDKELRDELEKHLSNMRRQEIIRGWHDREISAGKEWEGEIDRHLNTAQVILLLVSPDFIASDYCYDVEVKRAMERHENGDAVVIPILLRHVDYEGAPFARLQPLPKNRMPVTDWGNLDKDLDKAFRSVAQGIREAIKKLKGDSPNPDSTTGGSRGSSGVEKPLRRQVIYYLLLAAGAAISTPLLPKIVKFTQKSFQLSTFEFEVVTVDSQGQIVERNRKEARFFAENLDDGIDLEMVAIPQGEFNMGASEAEADLYDAKPQHFVKMAPFFMSKYPITQAQWRTVAKLPKVTLDLDPDPSRDFKGASLPVQWISWYEAVEFCERLSNKTGQKYRLPSEAEWEYACRAGTTTLFHFGEILKPELANYDSIPPYGSVRVGEGKTTTVGNFQVANAFGLYDMHGNVWEWCADYWHENYVGAPSDGTAWVSGGNDQARVLRGGSWAYPMENCRSAHRGNDEPGREGVTNDTGFRVAFLID